MSTFPVPSTLPEAARKPYQIRDGHSWALRRWLNPCFRLVLLPHNNSLTHPACHPTTPRHGLQRRARRAYLHPRNLQECLEPAANCIYRHPSRIVNVPLVSRWAASTSFDIVVMSCLVSAKEGGREVRNKEDQSVRMPSHPLALEPGRLA
jgi:hypothetical protein